jgi:hypothetical protein
MISEKYLARMGGGALDAAIRNIEDDISTIQRELRLHAQVNQGRPKSHEVAINETLMRSKLSRLQDCLPNLKSLQTILSEPLPQVHDGRDPDCRTCRSVRIVNSLQPGVSC